MDSRRRAMPEKLLLISDAAKCLGVKEEVAYTLTRLLLLETVQFIAGRRMVKGVSREALKKFQDDYVLASELANVKRCSSGKIATALAELGVHPVAGPSIGNCRQLVYRRAEIFPAIGVGFH